MREQTKKMISLLEEFGDLKKELFGGFSFAVLDEDKSGRYNQLLAYFHPEFRYKGWINPMELD